MTVALIIEDTQAMAEAACRKLHKAGYEALGCLNVAEALELCRERRPDLVIMEHFIGEDNSLTFLEQIAQPEAPMPIVVATGCGQEDIATKVMAAGALRYVVKDEGFLAGLPVLARSVQVEWDERRQAQEKGLLRRRLEAQNELAQWLAHNFKNILAASVGYLNLIDLGNPNQPVERQRDYLKDSRDSQQSAIDLLEQIIRMTDSEEGEKEALNIAELAAEAWLHATAKVLKLTAERFPERLEAVSQAVNSISFINSTECLEPQNMVRDDMALILEAILQNAVEAVLETEEPRVLVVAEKNERALEISVKDNGRGMSETVLRRALEPLFSTKGEVGVGLSLGLVNSLILRAGGDLNLKSTVGAGTTVKLIFPLS